MTKTEKLLHDVETLQESIKRDWQDMAALDLNATERRGIRKHIKWCALQLNYLAMQLELLDDSDA